eukprot:9401011-Alexandrium_andersonii.AAC.1
MPAAPLNWRPGQAAWAAGPRVRASSVGSPGPKASSDSRCLLRTTEPPTGRPDMTRRRFLEGPSPRTKRPL